MAQRRRPTARESLVVQSKVKEYVRSLGLSASAELAAALSDKVYALLDAAALRTRSNGRVTVRPHDL